MRDDVSEGWIISRKTPAILYLCPDSDVPSGGVRVIYRHVDVLNDAGMPATVLHGRSGFRCSWFEHNTRVAYISETCLDDAILVVPEVFGQRIATLAPGVRKVIFNQGAYNTFEGHSLERTDLTTPYRHPEVEAVIVVSEDSATYLRYVFPLMPVYRTVNAIDPQIFFPEPVRRRRLAFMTRRNLKDAVQIINILRFRGVLDDVELLRLEGLKEREVAERLRVSLVFLSLGVAEGCPTPPKEAMACGCLTIGYHGWGGRDFLGPEVAYPIQTGDILTFASTIETVLAEQLGDRIPLSSKGRAAAELIHKHYSLERERATVLECWERILAENAAGTGRHHYAWSGLSTMQVDKRQAAVVEGGKPSARATGLLLRDYSPRSQLRTEQHEIRKPSIPFIDAHNHLGRWYTRGLNWACADVPALVSLMDELSLELIVNLDGRWGEELQEDLRRYDHAYPERFATFCQLDWRDFAASGNPDGLLQSLRRSAESGARGLKVWKSLGLQYVDSDRRFILPDDPRLDPVWDAAGQLRLPVIIHVGDPLAFFDPVDRFNERYEELQAIPKWSFSNERFPRFWRLLGALENVVARHPNTTIVGAHMGSCAEDLSWVRRMLETYRNFHVDISARVAELGRQPRNAGALLRDHCDRILFGTDAIPDAAVYHVYFRFLETADEYFPYHADTSEPPLQGRWNIYGLSLPEEVLRRIYRDNARAILFA
jgi:predicted TIM-barrel fold metal-dependent hydrolase